MSIRIFWPMQFSVSGIFGYNKIAIILFGSVNASNSIFSACQNFQLSFFGFNRKPIFFPQGFHGFHAGFFGLEKNDFGFYKPREIRSDFHCFDFLFLIVGKQFLKFPIPNFLIVNISTFRMFGTLPEKYWEFMGLKNFSMGYFSSKIFQVEFSASLKFRNVDFVVFQILYFGFVIA